MPVHVLGIRHHGPGSARSVLQALESLQPDAVLIEGPPDADAVVPLLAHEEMRPPVALLIHAVEDLQKAVYYPFAAFSPEYQAIRYGLGRGVPTRFIDLPPSHRLALETETAEHEHEREDEHDPTPNAELVAPVRQDPLRFIAEAAGYTDSERWWEQMVEQRCDGGELFAAILEMMGALRENAEPEEDPIELLREAWMRQSIRAAEKEGFREIAVVCGAWHASALAERPRASGDAALLKGLPKVRVSATWVPWTYDRLAYQSGYGAGIQSPGYYELLWRHPRDVVTHWAARAGHLLREEDLDASPASLIETVRLAETMAALRGRTLAGLPELMESAEAVLCHGNATPLELISEKLIVGRVLGAVPDETPMVPLQRDLNREQKRLRLPPETGEKVVDLDLRNPMGLDRSRMLHRLGLLGIQWGRMERVSGKSGTFHEVWRLRWEPEMVVQVIEASVWGSTVADAASQRAVDRADKASTLADLTATLEACILAELPDATPRVMLQLQNMAAVTGDVPHLMDALSPLANVARYGSVRGADSGMVGHVVDGIVARVCIGLPAACSSLNDDAAGEMFDRIQAVHHAISLLNSDQHRDQWNGALTRLADLANAHGLISGRACRLLMDGEVWDSAESARRMNLALSVAEDPPRAAAWLEGFLRGSGLLLLHHEDLWRNLDEWLDGLREEDFTLLLPLLRRTFSTFSAAERRQMGQRAQTGGIRSQVADGQGFDKERAVRALPTIAALLGIPCPREALQ